MSSSRSHRNGSQPWAPTHGACLGAWDCGPVRVVETRHLAGSRLSAHTHDHSSLTFVLAGHMRERVDGRWIPVAAGQILAKPADAEHENAYGTSGTHSLILDFPEPGALDLGIREAFTPTGGGLVRALQVLRAFRERSAALALAAEELVHEVTGDPALVTTLDSSATPWLRRVRARIHDEFAPPPRLADIAREHGVHPGYLARAFRKAFGCSIGQYARRRQVSFVVKELAQGRSLSEAAFSAGFYDQAHLGRILRSRYGCTPAWLAGALPQRGPTASGFGSS